MSYLSTECRSIYQNIEIKTEKEPQDNKEEFERLLKQMKQIGIIAGIGVIVAIVIIIAVVLGGRR